MVSQSNQDMSTIWFNYDHVNSRSSSSHAEEKNHATYYVLKFTDEFYIQIQYANTLRVASSKVVACYATDCYADQIDDVARYTIKFNFQESTFT